MTLSQKIAAAFAAGALLLALPCHAACDKLVLSADPDYAPLHWHDGKELRGASIDLATRVLGELKIPYEVRYAGPWKRVLAVAEAGGIDMVVTLKITPERERFLAFVQPAAFPNPVAVYVERERAFIFRDRNDLKQRRGGIALGNKFGLDFEQYAVANLQLDEAGTIESNFRKLAIGRIDYYIVGLYTGETWLARHKQSEQFIAMRPFLAADQNYIAFVRGSACMQHFAAFEARLKELVKGGANLSILNANLQQLGIPLDASTLVRK